MNTYDNEVVVKFRGREYKARVTFGAIRSIEQNLGRGILSIARDCINSNLSITDLATIISIMLTTVDDPTIGRTTVDEVGEEIITSGSPKFFIMAAGYLSQAYTGPSLSDKKKDPTALARE